MWPSIVWNTPTLTVRFGTLIRTDISSIIYKTQAECSLYDSRNFDLELLFIPGENCNGRRIDDDPLTNIDHAARKVGAEHYVSRATFTSVSVIRCQLHGCLRQD
jgi:hypothetical protein